MTRPEPITVGLVGCGRVAEVAYLPALRRAGSIRLVAVADRDAARRQHVSSLATDAGPDAVAAFPDAAGLLERASVDAVILATPAEGRSADASLAVSAGCAVLVEKPPAVDAEDAARLAALDPPPWVGFNRRFDPGAQAVRGVTAGRRDIELRLAIRYRRAAWGAHRVRDDALLDLGPHLVDWARWLTGRDVLEVAAASLTSERAELDLRLDGARAICSAATDRVHREVIDVHEAGGRLTRHRAGGIAAALLDRIRPAAATTTLVDTVAGQLEALAAAVRGEPSPLLGTACDGLAVMTVLDAARASARTGRAVPVPAVTSGASDDRRPT